MREIKISIKPGAVFSALAAALMITLGGSAFLSAAEAFFPAVHGQSSGDASPVSTSPVKIGYFFGGKSYSLFRAYANDYFTREGVNIDFYSQYMLRAGFHKVPNTCEELRGKKRNAGGKKTYFGKLTGTEIITAVEQGFFEGGTSGESSFLMAVNYGSPIVAVAMLGKGEAERPDKGILIRKGVLIERPEDFKGKTLIARRAGESDSVFLKEFIEDIGLVSGRDVTVMEQVSEDKIEGLMRDKKVDGGLFHIDTLKKTVAKDLGYVYRKMDWLSPELSQGLLVFRKDFVKSNPEVVSRIVRAYMKSLKDESSVPEQDRIPDRRNDCAPFALHFQGMNLPQGSYPPLVRVDMLNTMQRLLLKYHSVDKEIDLSGFVDNTFVDRAYAEMK